MICSASRSVVNPKKKNLLNEAQVEIKEGFSKYEVFDVSKASYIMLKIANNAKRPRPWRKSEDVNNKTYSDIIFSTVLHKLDI